MKKITRKIFLLLFTLAASLPGSAQWCNVTSAIPYAPEMPGITNVTVSTINRTSLPIEDYPNNSYVNTGITATLTQEQTYLLSITHSRDAVYFPNCPNHIRVWVDYNQDYSFDDPGETVVVLNYQPYGTSTASFTVPANATPGTTRMRITAKMSDQCGHTVPTSCDFPPDPLGYHGEIEDYNIIISSATGINNLTEAVNSFMLSPNPASTNLIVDFALEQSSLMSLSIYDAVGKRIYVSDPVTKSVGKHSINLRLSDMNIKEAGVYFLEIISDNKKSVQKFMVK